MKSLLRFSCCLMSVNSVQAFVTNKHHQNGLSSGPSFVLGKSASALAVSTQQDEAQKLLERAKQMREEIASLEGKSVDQVESEAQQKKDMVKAIAAKAAAERQEMAAAKETQKKLQTVNLQNGKYLAVPDTAEDQVRLAKGAIERAFQDGVTRQIVRFALLPEDEYLNQNDRQWPGGAQQMYREAAGPMTRNLLETVRAPTSTPVVADDGMDESSSASLWNQKTNVTSQDVWDFDGSALVTAFAPNAKDDVQALVLSNTDNKYTKDIAEISNVMGKRLFMLVNPFWRNLDSWGFNILAPKAKQMAQEVIFDGGFQDTYVCLQTSVRGEDCIALKVYPYDWQLYAYAETEYWPYEEYTTHLGSTKDEPTSKDFGEFMKDREEFKMSKNMRQMQRMMGNNNDD